METLPQALKRDPGTGGGYARLKACATHRLYTRCETAVSAVTEFAPREGVILSVT
jgi:hypothetical protein